MPHTQELSAIESALQAIQRVCEQGFDNDLDLCRAILFDQHVLDSLTDQALKLIAQEPDALKIHYQSRLINVADLLDFIIDKMGNIKYLLPNRIDLRHEALKQQIDKFDKIYDQIIVPYRQEKNIGCPPEDFQAALFTEQKININRIIEGLPKQPSDTPGSSLATPSTSSQTPLDQNTGLESDDNGLTKRFEVIVREALKQCGGSNLRVICQHLLTKPEMMLGKFAQYFEPESFQMALSSQNSIGKGVKSANVSKILKIMLEELAKNPSEYPEVSKALFATAVRRLEEFKQTESLEAVPSVMHQSDLDVVKQHFKIESYKEDGHEQPLKHSGLSKHVLGEQLALALYHEHGVEKETRSTYIVSNQTLHIGIQIDQPASLKMGIEDVETAVSNRKEAYLVDVFLGNPHVIEQVVTPRIELSIGNLLTQLMDDDVALENQIPEKLDVVDLFKGLRKLTEINNSDLQKCIDQYVEEKPEFLGRLLERKEKLIDQVVAEIVTKLNKVDLFEQFKILQSVGIVDKEKAADICKDIIKARDGGLEQIKISIIDALKNSQQDQFAVVSFPEPKVDIKSVEEKLDNKIATVNSSANVEMIKQDEISSSSDQESTDEQLLITVLHIRVIVAQLEADEHYSFGFKDEDYFLMKVASTYYLTMSGQLIDNSNYNQLVVAVGARQWLLDEQFSLKDADQVFDTIAFKGRPAEQSKNPFALILNRVDQVFKEKDLAGYMQGCMLRLNTMQLTVTKLVDQNISVALVNESYAQAEKDLVSSSEKTSKEIGVQVDQEIQKPFLSRSLLFVSLSSTVVAIGSGLLQKLGGFRGHSTSKVVMAGAGFGALIAGTYKYATSKELTPGNITEVTERLESPSPTGKLGRSRSPSPRPATPRSEMQQRTALSSG